MPHCPLPSGFIDAMPVAAANAIRPLNTDVADCALPPPSAKRTAGVTAMTPVVHPRPALGYAMVAAAATLFAVNAPVVKVIEHTGIDAQRLTEVRSTGAFVGLALIVLATRRAAVRTRRRELVLLVTLGIGIALVQ